MVLNLRDCVLRHGAFGSVHVAKYCGVDVAVKTVLHPVEEEATLLASMRHRHIVRLIGACIAPPYCLVTEYAPHGSLFDHIRRAPAYGAPAIIDWALQIARGVEYLHTGLSHIILHRDLKAANVLVFDDDSAATRRRFSQRDPAASGATGGSERLPPLLLKLCDFGSSRSFTRDTIMTFAGTIPWLAPEALRCERVSEKCDVYRCVSESVSERDGE